jgi:membrane protease YdiL (CAAX protease family)
MFALSHIPQRLVSDHEHGVVLAEDLVVLAWRGLALALVYLRTGHLEVAVGFHALWDVPLPVIASPIAGEAIIGAQVVLFVVWPYGANTSGVRNVRPAPA